MPYRDKHKKAERAILLAAPPCNDSDIAAFAVKYDDMPVMVFINEVWHVNGRFQMKNIYSNKAAQAQTGFTGDEMLAMGKKIRREMLHPEDVEGVQKMFDFLHLAGNKHKIIKTTYRIQHKSGGYILGRGLSTLMKPAKNRSHGVIRNFFEPLPYELLNHNRFRILIAQSNFTNRCHRLEKLTSRQKDILQLIAKKFSNKEIADLLPISERTVEKHREQIITFLGLRNEQSLKCYCCEIALWLNELEGKW